ncbi:MAG: endonuclease III [Heliobacteriaceae bacterium]|jgi:endonuclease-3|nr:endonuclease III [Heliobacteriaceae bacterium]
MTDIDQIIKTLKQAKQPMSDFVHLMENYTDPYLVLISCILSLRTNDKTTYPATLRMFELGKTPEDFAKIDVKKLEQAIYPVGFYTNKARQIVQLSKELVEEYNSKVPDTIEELIKFNGVGRKTANLVLARGFNKPAICVDVHVHRICNRLGYVKTKTPEETEFALREKLPVKYWIDINTLLVTHGQNVCKPVKPDCTQCPVAQYCAKKIM